jgi:hypothetical protein
MSVIAILLSKLATDMKLLVFAGGAGFAGLRNKLSQPLDKPVAHLPCEF